MLNQIPTALFHEKDLVIGQPDAVDWGVFFVETNIRGEQRYWLIDKMESNIPRYFLPFTEAIDKAIRTLSSN